MLKLYGFPISNYYNMVKMTLLEKDLAFEEVDVRPNQDADFLARSPMGKVPALETDAGHLCETSVIMDYLETLAPEPALLPADAFAAAKVRELTKALELYVELPARRCFPEAFFGGSVSDDVKAESRADLERGIAAVGRLTRFDPYIAGPSFSQADIMFCYSFPLAASVGRKLLDLDLFAALPGSSELLEQLKQRPSAQRIRADQQA